MILITASCTTSRFRKAFRRLSKDIKILTLKKYELWNRLPYHSSLRFKNIYKEIYSIRICTGYRALGVKVDKTMIWFWIGLIADYDKLLKEYKSC